MKPSHFLTSDVSSINSVPIGDDVVTRDVIKIINCDDDGSVNTRNNSVKAEFEIAPLATSSDAASDVDGIDASAVDSVNVSEVDSVNAVVDDVDVDVVSDNIDSERSDSFEKVESEPKKNRK